MPATSSFTPTPPTRSATEPRCPTEIAAAAAGLGHRACALTDHDNLCGAMEFAQACSDLGVRPILGAELTVDPGPGRSGRVHLTLLVEDATGWANLCRLITEAHAATRDGPGRDPLPPSLPLGSLLDRNEGLVCLSGCAARRASPAPGSAAGRGPPRRSRRRLLAGFGRDRFRIELQRPFWRRDRARNRHLAGLAERLGVACVATGNVHSHDRARAELQDALVAVREHRPLEECRAAAARQLELGARPSGGDDGPLRRPSRGGRRERTAGGAAALRPDAASSATATRAPRTPRPTGRLAEICRSRLELRYEGARERAGGRAAARGGAAA